MPHTDEDNRSAAKFLMENVALLPRGRVLDLAMGTGRNALYLAKIGFSVHGVDISPETVKGVLKSATATGLTLEAEIADLDGDYRIKENAWDVIICFYYLQRSLMARIKDGLRKGGIQRTRITCYGPTTCGTRSAISGACATARESWRDERRWPAWSRKKPSPAACRWHGRGQRQAPGGSYGAALSGSR